jgi:hypothetical protein
MKKTGIFYSIVLLVLIAGNVFAVDLSKWRYRSAVTTENAWSQDYCVLEVTPEIYSYAKVDLSDIRLIDSSEQQVPYVLFKPKDETGRHKYRPTVLNRSINKDGAGMLTLDFGEKVLKNSIEVITEGASFRRDVRIEGSNDNIEYFAMVEQAYIFAVGDRKESRFSEVEMPSNDYRYLRITVWPMMSEDKSPVIREARTYKIERSTAKRIDVQMTEIEHTQDEQNDTSIYIYDFANTSLPISEIELDIEDDSFYRYVSLQGRDSATRKVKLDSEDNRERYEEVKVSFKNVVSDSIYHYTESSGRERKKFFLRIPAGQRLYRYLRLTIHNNDDLPIAVKSASAKMIPHRLLFESERGDSIELYVGCELAKTPKYDLKKTIDEPASYEAATSSAGQITENPLFGTTPKKQPWSERHKAAGLIIILIVVAVMGVFILRSYRKIQTGQGEE